MAVPDPEEADEAVVELDSDSDGAAGGTEGDDDDENENENENVAGTDDDVPPPDGENYFGRAAKEGAAPAGANPFAVPAPAADDDWAREIAEAKRMVEEQRVKREREEAIERQKEIEAAEAKGKVYEERRKAGDSPLPSAGGGGGGGAARRERKIVRARRPTGGGGGITPTPAGGGDGGNGGNGGGGGGGGGGASPFAGFSFAPPSSAAPSSAGSPFSGFSLLSKSERPAPPDAGKDAPPVTAVTGGGILSRLSGAPKPFVEPEPEPEAEAEVEVEVERREERVEAAAKREPFAPSEAPKPVLPVRTALAVELDL